MELACLDGAFAPSAETTIPATDEGFLRGDGVFEVMRVYDGRPFALREHLDRLERSAANIRLPDGVPRAELEREIPELLERRGGAADEFVAVPEAFLVSTTGEVQPVSAIESRVLTALGERTRAAAAAIRSHIQAALGAD